MPLRFRSVIYRFARRVEPFLRGFLGGRRKDACQVVKRDQRIGCIAARSSGPAEKQRRGEQDG